MAPPKPLRPSSKNLEGSATLQSWQIGLTSGYELLPKLGQVPRAVSTTASSWELRVAIKQLFSSFIDPSNLDEFSREVTLLHKLKHR